MHGSNINKKDRNERALTASTDSWVDNYQTLQGRPHQDKALLMLKKVASLVKPIMRSHNWRLPLLSEFFPDNPSLVGLNVNMGQQILLRLRPHHSPNVFYSEEEVVSVILHELTHNVHGPHDDKFYKYLAGLESEYNDLQRRGYAGEGFFAPGQKLGESTLASKNMTPAQAKQRALEAAERRAKSGLLGSGANKLGGPGWTTKNLIKSPRQLAVEAAERRARDAKACAHDEKAEAEAAKAAEQGARHAAADVPEVNYNDVIVIDSSDEDSDVELLSVTKDGKTIEAGTKTGAAGPSKAASSSSTSGSAPLPPTRSSATIQGISSFAPASSPKPNPASNPVKTSSTISPASFSPAPAPVSASVEWSCEACTLLNQPTSNTCEICLTPKSKPAVLTASPSNPTTSSTIRAPVQGASIETPGGWDCLSCGEKGMPHSFWTCRFCGWVKASSTTAA